MDLLIFWVVGIYALCYCAFFVALLEPVELKWAGSQRTSWRTFWPALFITTLASLAWPFFLVRHFYGKDNRVRTR